MKAPRTPYLLILLLTTACSGSSGGELVSSELDPSSAADSGSAPGMDASEDRDPLPEAGGEPDTGVSQRDASICVPTGPEECNGLDDDCSGFSDDLDVGEDGITDCLRILLLGNPGANASADFNAWLTSQGTTVTRANTDPTEVLTPELLASYNVVVLDRLVRAYTEAESDALRQWVEQGGGLVSLNGYDASQDLPRGNSALTALGIEHVPDLRSGPITIFSDHPTTRGLTSITFSGGFVVQPLPEDPAANNTVVASFAPVAGAATGPAAAIAQERGKGRAFIWGDEWVEFDSEWGSMPEIQQFWVQVLGWLARVR